MASHLSQALTQNLSRVIGHNVIKQGLVLALVAKEHVYIEGPPGVAKTMLAEALASATALPFFLYQMHRDTRLSELIGESAVLRSKDPDTGGELISTMNRPDGLLTAHLCVLDDISRAPGESLNAIFRILNERKMGDSVIPLRSAIATANPSNEGVYYTQPLDRALLDRFTVQMRVDGHLQSGRWSIVEELLALESSKSSSSDQENTTFDGVVLGEQLDEAYKLLKLVTVPGEVENILFEFMQRLQEACVNTEGKGHEGHLLTDRTFLVKAIKIMKAKAVLEGRLECIPQDLKVLLALTFKKSLLSALILQVMSYLSTFRIPAALESEMESIINELTAGPEAGSEEELEGVDTYDTQMDLSDASDKTSGITSDADGVDGDMGSANGDADSDPGDANQGKERQACESQKMLDEMAQGSIVWSMEAEGCSLELLDMLDEEEEKALQADIAKVLAVLHGKLHHAGKVDELPHPGGHPRRWIPSHTLNDALDSMNQGDSSEWVNWLHNGCGTALPRALERTRIDAGGSIAILRDVSQSMTGERARWAGGLVRGLTEVSKQLKLNMGYIEFSNSPQLFTSNGQFFQRNYKKLNLLSRRRSNCDGLTDISWAVGSALQQFVLLKRTQSHLQGNSHILLISDGYPTAGDTLCEDVRELAKELGVCVHVVHLCGHTVKMMKHIQTIPGPIRNLADGTGGAKFFAHKNAETGIAN